MARFRKDGFANSRGGCEMKYKLLALCAASSVMTTAASAALVVTNNATFTGSTAGQPTWNRPLAGSPPTGLSAVGTAVSYQSTAFTVASTGNYIFQSIATSPVNWDNYSFLYANSFNAAAPLTNVLVGNDDNPTIGLSGFTRNLTAGINYFFVETGFGNSDAGSYTVTINEVQQAVPEPATWAMMLLGFGMIGFGMRYGVRRSNAKFDLKVKRIAAGLKA